jgi:2-polyprenyl-3-methyl-5-hydroxy-6-metoxy-1,4-benzoquinol methylase
MEKKVYDFIQQSETNHWWFVGRRLIIKKILKKFIQCSVEEALDIGSGFGGMIPLLLTFSKNVDSVEPMIKSKESILEYGARNIYSFTDFPDQIPDKTYNIVTMFDVLEHIEDHEKALFVINKKLLKDKGLMLLTVPAFSWLWSNHDVINHHYRRYTKKQVRMLLKENGYQVLKISYIMTFLFPLAILQRLFWKYSFSKEEFKPVNPILNWFLKQIFSLESLVIPYLTFPFGLSIIAIAEK